MRKPLITAALLATLTGCNELDFVPAAGHAGEAVNVTAILSLDEPAAGAELELLIESPLSISYCIPSIMTDGISSAARIAGKVKLVALAQIGGAPWSGALPLYTCRVIIPAGTPTGTYFIVPQKQILSNPDGRAIPFVANKGVIHVIP